MKRLLTIFSVFVLGFGSSLGVVSCTVRAKHEPEEDEMEGHQDLEILNQIKKEAKQTLSTWWQTKTMIDIIKEYPEQISSFEELVTELKTKNDGLLTLTSTAISKYRFLHQLLVGFKAEFNNLNQDLQDRYSNYYVDTMPLFLGENDISFTLYNINFENIAKLLEDTPQAVLGIRVQVNIAYEVRFKELSPVQDNINKNVVIGNNIDILHNIIKQLAEYFSIFIDNILKKLDYNIIITEFSNYVDLPLVSVFRSLIEQKVKEKKIMFYWVNRFNNISGIMHDIFKENKYFYKDDSVLKWAKEGYNPNKLTKENFLKFYKQKYSFKEIGDYYVRGVATYINLEDMFIENMPLTEEGGGYRGQKLKTPVNVLVPKDKVDQQLEEFAKVTMDFWHYYQLETYSNGNLVFNMNQTNFDELVKSASVLEQKGEIITLLLIFKLIFNFFKNTLNLKSKFSTFMNANRYKYKVNFIKKQQSFVVELFCSKVKCQDETIVNFFYNFFAYSFNINSHIVNDSFAFLRKFEFRVG
ncbi:hypothetical protein [Spiroplasma melliferum]|uniref:hypothetical protein n=1 Tax=Spiroplasma melliferum TaxID=2134 RepID=UPI000C78B1DA|nr:hypothetical protein [Spiroplasma melliferum]